MIVKYMDIGKKRLFILRDDKEGEYVSLKLVKAFGYRYYPRVNSLGKILVNESYSGYLYKKEKLRETSVSTVGKKLYDALNLPTIDIDIPKDDLEPNSVVLKELKNKITDGKIVFIAGRGIGNKLNYERLKKLAIKFNANVGCSRPVAMNGWESYENFVGISGNILSSDLVVTFGVAGATPFIKGIENCKTIIAINNDKNALIFKNADYGILDDCMNVITYLEKI